MDYFIYALGAAALAWWLTDVDRTWLIGGVTAIGVVEAIGDYDVL